MNLLFALALLAAPEDGAREALRDGALRALAGERAALARFEKAALLLPDQPAVQNALGAAALLLGELNTARRVLARDPRMRVYRAMALLDGPGGMGRAEGELAAGEKEDEPGALFLAALAFARAGQMDRADRVLARAVERASSALSESFAPDPAVAMSREVIAAFEATGGATRIRAELAVALLEANRRREALALARASLAHPEGRAAGLRVLVLVGHTTDAPRALEQVERVLREEPEAEDARVAKLVLLERTGDREGAKQLARAIGAGPELEGELAATVFATRARLAIADGDFERAFEHVQDGLRKRSDSNELVALAIESLLGAKKAERAAAFAKALLDRAPTDVDPFRWLERVERARGRERHAAQAALRSEAFAKAAAEVERVVRAKERVLREVEQAEGAALGAAGLDALRQERPGLALPVDLLIARVGSTGHRRSARDRILAACAPALRRLLAARRGFDFAEIAVSHYGKVVSLEAPLSGADPERCAPAALRVGGRRR